MQKSKAFTISIIAIVLLILPELKGALAQGTVTIKDIPPVITFPESIKFQAQITASEPPQSVILEYGVAQLTCGTVIAKAFPEFSGSNPYEVEWTWEMLQSGTLPTGAEVWWQWRVTDSNGNETVSKREALTWLDDVHNWQSIKSDGVNLYWYEGGRSFGKEMHTAAVDAMTRLETEAGLTSEEDVSLYIYGSTDDLREALLYEPGWTGGVAFPENNIVLIGISPDNTEWGVSTISHELTHVLVGHFTFSCLGNVPTWLNEGLAVYSEGSLDSASQAQFDEAIRTDTLIPLRALSGGFSEEPDKADLSYSESYSVVDFLIKDYGHDKMEELLIAFRDGATVDDALLKVYNMDVEGLEDAWRASIGAKVRPPVESPTQTPSPTPVPTIKPVSGLSIVAATPTSRPTFTPSPQPTITPRLYAVPQEVANKAAVPITVILAILCVAVLLLALGGTIFFAARNQKKQAEEAKKEEQL